MTNRDRKGWIFFYPILTLVIESYKIPRDGERQKTLEAMILRVQYNLDNWKT